MKKIGVYAPYLSFLGGGEKVAVTMAESLAKDNQVDLIAHEVNAPGKIEQRFGQDLSKVKFRVVSEKDVGQASREYDLFINNTNYLPCPAKAKKNFLYCHFPFSRTASQNGAVKIFQALKRILRGNSLDDYQGLMVNSEFTRREVKKRWGRDSLILNPPVNIFKPLSKKKIILHVGRFISVGHCKKQLELARAFKELNQKEKGWELHLAGAINEEKRHLDYLEKVKKEAEGLPVKFHINMTFDRLARLYGESSIYWHATGYGEDEEKEPWKMEHFGISTVEAMSAGCIPIVIDKGGQKEIVKTGENGFLWNGLEELVEMTERVINDADLAQRTRKKAVSDSQAYSAERFEERLREIVLG